MTWSAPGPRNPSEDGIQRHDVSENDICVICIPAVQKASDPASDGRPQQDSNLRSRLRRAIPNNSLTCADIHQPAILARCGDAGTVARPLSGWTLQGPGSGREALPGFTSGWLVLRIDAVLAEQGAEPLDLLGELLDPFGQIRQRRVPGGPLVPLRGLGGQQFLLPVTQRRGLLKVLGVDGGFLLAADLGDLLIQLTGLRTGPNSLLDGREPLLDRLQASLQHFRQAECPQGRCGRHGLLSLVSVQQLDARWRTRFRSAPSLTSTWAATPSPSWMRPSRMCSVPM
jgi:hypothetical protein